MSVGMLTGRPAEEMPGSADDLLSELSYLHEQVRQVMQGVAQALWPSVSLPEGVAELMEKVLQSLQRSSREHGGTSDYGRYRPADKVPEKPGPW